MTESKPEHTSLTIFEAGEPERQEAIKALLTGVTPGDEVKEVRTRGNKTVPSVNVYYMTRQAGLITGFRWSHTKLSEKWWPNEQHPVEYEMEVRVDIWDRDGNIYSHEASGSGDVSFHSDRRGNVLSWTNIKNSARSRAIKKCLSYFGIAHDVYRRKEVIEDTEDYFGETQTKDQSTTTTEEDYF
jgi:hypothetical protein